MTYCLGIDAGGTYTDAVIIDMDHNRIVSSGSALTTYPDPIGGIRCVLDALDGTLLNQVKAVSVSTTLATNTVLENTGDPAALILVGDCAIPEDAAISDYTVVRGGHTHDGTEAEALDIDAVRAFVERVKDHVSAFAVSSFFSVRNPDHEQRIKALIHDMTGCPVICGHELAQSLGAYERGVTAYLNATLLPVTRRFMASIQKEMARRGSEADINVLKCNGSVCHVNEAMYSPVESVFSGPAASLLGASWLSGLDTCLMIDVGGTSTDVSMINNGIALTDESGATVGNWKTKVMALKMETSAMGGDSLVWIRSPSVSSYDNLKKINIGPKKVIPICRAASDFPEIVDSIKKRWFSDRHRFSPFIQPAAFYMRADAAGADVTSDLTPEAAKVYERIGHRPTSIMDVTWDMRFVPTEAINELVRNKKIHVIGLTPTDILHAAGVFNEWNTEASTLAVSLVSAFVQMTPEEFCACIRRLFAQNMVREIVYFLCGTLSRDEITRFLDQNDRAVIFKTAVPIVMIGGPVGAYLDDVRQYLDAPISVPPYAAIGNAVGALMGKISKRIEVNIRLAYNDSKYGIRTKSIMVYTPTGRRIFPTIDEAVSFSEKYGKDMIYDYMRRIPVDDKDVRYSVKTENISIGGGSLPISLKYIFEGVATPRLLKL